MILFTPPTPLDDYAKHFTFLSKFTDVNKTLDHLGAVVASVRYKINVLLT